MDSIMLSILIPTYNRYKYLKGCLSSIHRIKSNLFEIIVQDNTIDNLEIIDFIEELNDPRIKYYHYSEHISQSENSDLAMSHAEGKYIVMIGDDDTICECIIDAAIFCDKHDIEAANYLIPGFNWPDMEFIGKEREPNFFIDEKADGTVIIQDEKLELKKALKFATGLSDTMPRAYHGIVSKKCMDRIFEKTGSYFPGPSPDMGNAAAVCLEAEKTAFIYDYLIISGYGYNSARGEGNRQQHHGKIKEKPWLPKDILERWDKSIPMVFSGETIIATSLTESLKRMNRQDLVMQYNYGVLYAIFIRHHLNDILEMIHFCLKKPDRMIKLIKGIVEREKIRREILARPKRQLFYTDNNIDSLEKAQDIIEEIRKKLGIKDLIFVEGC